MKKPRSGAAPGLPMRASGVYPPGTVNIAWRALGVVKLAILTLSAAVSIGRADAFPAIIFAAGILALNAAGMRWGLKAGERLGMERGDAAVRTLLLGSFWWGPVLSPGRAGDAPSGGEGERGKET